MALQQLARSLISDLVRDHSGSYGGSSMTCSIYDTAWVSLLVKPENDEVGWLFPSCFEFLLSAQHTSGGWALANPATDTVLHTAAGLYALCKHQISKRAENLQERIRSATGFLQDNLQRLKIDATLPIGFEVLLPMLLGRLDRECGIQLEFPTKRALLQRREEKLIHFNIQNLYDGSDYIILHYLEAFVDHIDFDELRQYKVLGSMMASPSSTAAYLMNVTAWDTEAEDYLREVVLHGPGKGHGGVPSVFPSTLSEYSLVVSTLLESGFTCVDLDLSNLQTIQHSLQDAFDCNKETIGRTSLLELGASDIMRVIITLNQLGVSMSSSLNTKYSAGGHYGTYFKERTADLSAHSNFLIAMFSSSERTKYTHEIERVAKILCEHWLEDPKSIIYHENKSSYYSMMLTSKALKSVIDGWSQKTLPEASLQLLREAIVVVFQILVRLLQAQEEDGSWSRQRESSAYALIAINEIASLSIAEPLVRQIKYTIQKGREFLSTTLRCCQQPEYVWRHKVAYGSSCLSRAFSLAALNCSIKAASDRLQELLPGSLHAILKPSHFFAQLPMFSRTPKWCIEAWLIEGALFQHGLGERYLDEFSQQEKRKAKYLSIIPFTWTASNNIHGGHIGSNIMLEMMAICALAYQIDDFIETEVACLPLDVIGMIKHSIPDLFHEVEVEETIFNSQHAYSRGIEQRQVAPVADSPQPAEWTTHVQGRESCSLLSAEIPSFLRGRVVQISRDLKRILRHLWQAPYVRTATNHAAAQLKISAVDYITAHLIQTEQSKRLAAQPPPEESNHKTLENIPSSLLTWVRTVSGDHTIGPYAVAALCCMYDPGSDGSCSPQADYILQDVAHHLAALCRLYNDYGSIVRDRDENNLNSVNFPEFRGHLDDTALKKHLASIAEYERSCLHVSMAELRPLVSDGLYAALTVLCETAEMYNQMYVLKDLTAVFNKA
ncbi:hypothetical protein F5Y07DRAFT_277545 [Xylaria sp. FL0933]|nr:hypothetical protein F5Y07DRAFT_277545 [Xylaria sp. FL0933]